MKLTNIAMGKDGLPEFWRSWSPLQRAAYLENRYTDFKTRTGVDIKTLVNRALLSELILLRARLAADKRLAAKAREKVDPRAASAAALERYRQAARIR